MGRNSHVSNNSKCYWVEIIEDPDAVICSILHILFTCSIPVYFIFIPEQYVTCSLTSTASDIVQNMEIHKEKY